MILKGFVRKGLGEGKAFLSMEHYRNQLLEKLGFDVYPGTLNIEIKQDVKLSAPIRITGFTKEGSKFGGATCHEAKLNGAKTFLIVPDFNKHGKNILEFVSQGNLRKKLKLADNDEVTIEV